MITASSVGREGELKNLSSIALFIAHHVRNAIQARLVMSVVDLFFQGQPSRFRTNPANCLQYSALRALEERLIVAISETLRDEHGLFPLSIQIPRKPELDLHRDGLSHPMTVKWRRADRQAFFDDRRVIKDSPAAVIWDVQRTVNNELLANGQKSHNEDIPVTFEMATMVHQILRQACASGYAPPDAQTILDETLLQQAREHFLRHLEAHADGRMTSQPEAAASSFAARPALTEAGGGTDW